MSLLRGIDVSYCQREVNWGLVAQAGKTFAYLKTSQSKPDVMFAQHWAGARAVGILVGCYHYLDKRVPIAEQVELFLATYRDVPGFAELPPALDVEEAGDKEAPAQLVGRVLTWLEMVEDELGTTPLVYTTPNFASTRMRCPLRARLARYPLWIAHVGVEAATVPAPWSSWAGWQYTWKGRCAGVRGDVDLDYLRSV